MKKISGYLLAFLVLIFLNSCNKDVSTEHTGKKLKSATKNSEVDTKKDYGNDTPEQNQNSCSHPSLTVKRDQEFIDLFTRYGDGWTGADATYSILLPDGRTLWMFGDTFLGTVNPDRSRQPIGLTRNTFVVQDGDELTTYVQPDGKAFVKPENDSWWYWPTDGIVYNDTLQILLYAFETKRDTVRYRVFRII